MGTTWSTILLAASIRSLDQRREHLGENFQLRFQIRPGVSALWYTSSLSKRKLIKIPYLVLIYDSSHDKANATDTRITAASGNFVVRPMTENAVPAALRRMGYPKEEMTGHGFRSMASTLLHEQAGTIKLLSASLPMLSAMR
jgi:hypothetical protein